MVSIRFIITPVCHIHASDLILPCCFSMGYNTNVTRVLHFQDYTFQQ